MGLFGRLWKKKDASLGAQITPSAPPKTIRVSNFLSEKSICFFQTSLAKEEAFKKLIYSFQLSDPEAAIKAVLEREAVGTTVISPGLAIPHARLAGLSALVAGMGICPAGIPDPSTEGGLVKLLILFLGPTSNMKDHLGFLASAASLLQIDGFTDLLLQQTSPVDVMAKIREAEKTL